MSKFDIYELTPYFSDFTDANSNVKSTTTKTNVETTSGMNVGNNDSQSNYCTPRIHEHPGFKFFIQNLLRISMCNQETIDILTNQDNLKIFTKAFTSSSVSKENYEFYELLGDAHLNCAIVSYLKQRFPDLCNPDGVKYLARLKIDYVSRQKFSKYAQDLNFDQFIRCSDEERLNGRVKKAIAEDVFEAFAGCIVAICDTFDPFSSQKYCFFLVKHAMDQEKISLDYEDLFDAKSRLKEIFDLLKNYSMKYEYEYFSDPVKREFKHTTRILVRTPQGVQFVAGLGVERTKKCSSQIASQAAIDLLKKRGIVSSKYK